MKKLWITLVTTMHMTNYREVDRRPRIHGVYGSEEEMLAAYADHGPAKRWHDTDIYTWGEQRGMDGVLVWGLPFDADIRQLRIALGQQWFAPDALKPEVGQTTCVLLEGDPVPQEGEYLGDGVWQAGGLDNVRSDSVRAWRPLPGKGEAWPAEPLPYEVRR